MIESISITLCRKTASGNLVQFQLSVIRGSSFSVSLRLTSSLGEAGLGSEHPSPVWRVQQGLQLPSGISLVLCAYRNFCSIHHLSYTAFPGPNIWWRMMNLTQMCVVGRSFLCKSPGSVSLFMQPLGHNCVFPKPEPSWARNQSCVPVCSFQQHQILERTRTPKVFYFYCEPSELSRKYPGNLH